MANFSKIQQQALDEGFVDLNVSKQVVAVDFANDLKNTMKQLANVYTAGLQDSLRKKKSITSGKLADSIKPRDAKVGKNSVSIDIETLRYASFIDEGVDGWHKSRGSRFKFKTKGVDPKGQHVKSMKEYLATKQSQARNVKVAISERERAGKSIVDASTRAAMTAAFMVKKYGIKPNRFWQETTDEFREFMEEELGTAVKIQIINTLKK